MKLIDDVYIKQIQSVPKEAEKHFHAVTAIVLTSCPAGRLRENNHLGTPISYFSKHIDLINTLHRPGQNTVYSIRYVSMPHASSVSGGVIHVCIFCKVTASIAEKAFSFAAEQTEQLLVQLCANLSEYQWEVVKDEKQFEQLWEPFDWDTAEVVDIRRRENLISLDQVKANHSLGFVRTEDTQVEEQTTQPVYFVHSFIQHSGQLERFMKVMMLAQHPLALTVTLKPATLTAEEEQSMLAEVSRSEGYHESTTASIQRIQQQLSQIVGQGLMDQILTLQDAPFYLTISLASTARIHRTLAESAGLSISASVGEVPNELYVAPGLIQKGGYDVVYPSTLEELSIARANARNLEQRTWAHSSAPESLRRLRYLMPGLEAANAFRFPEENGRGVPGVDVHTLISRPLPRELMPDGANHSGGLLIGKNTYLGLPQEVYMPTRDRLSHMYIVGQTGTGKTTLLKTMILSDMRAGRGCALVDPHGDLFEELLGMIPPGREDDVVVFDPSDVDFPVGLNLLEARDENEKHFIVREMKSIMERLIADQYGEYNAQQYTGPMFYLHMQMNMLLSMSDPDSPGTILQFYQIFQEKNYWKRWTPLKINDPKVEDWVKHTLPSTDYISSSRPGEISIGNYVSSKFTDFVFDPRLRAIFGQTKSTIDFEKVMDEGKILLINLAKGLLGESNSRFLGFIIMAKLQAEAMKRAKIASDKRNPFFLYVDEFQSLATDNFTVMLSEARKFGLGLVLANQFISQITNQKIIQAVFGNVGSIMSFRLGRLDSELVETQFLPHFDRIHLSNQPNWQIAARLNVAGKSLPPFSLNTLKSDIQPDKQLAGEVRRRSRERYGTPAAQVNEMISRSLQNDGAQDGLSF